MISDRKKKNRKKSKKEKRKRTDRRVTDVRQKLCDFCLFPHRASCFAFPLFCPKSGQKASADA
jgi:hypothetical protein